MIAYIRGIIDEITEQAVLIETNGIGYEVICPNPFQFQAMLGQKEKIYTYHHVRRMPKLCMAFKSQRKSNYSQRY